MINVLKRWPREAALHLRSFAIAVLLVMIAFYAIAAFHAEALLSWLLTHVPISEIGVYYAMAITTMFLMAIGVKGGFIWLLGPKPSSWIRWKRIFMAVTFYLIMVASAALSCVLLVRRLHLLMGTPYWRQSQWFWLGMLLFVAFGFLGLMLRRFELYERSVLRELRALPFVSPLFCFAGPKFFLDNAQKFGVPAAELRAHAVLMIVAGFLFLAYLFMFALLIGWKTKTSSHTVVLPGGSTRAARTGEEASSFVTSACFVVLGAALYVFSLALLDATLRMALATEATA